MDIRDVESINTSRGFRFLGVNEERLVGVPVEDMIKTTDAYSSIRKDINVIKSDLVENKNAIADLNDKKITKFYANNLGETTLNDSDDGKIVDMKIYGKSEQKQYSGKNLLDCSGLTEQTINGVTFTPIYDNGLLQYININGTVTDTVNYLIFDDDNFTNENRFISIMEQEISGIKGHLAITEISGTLEDTLNVIFPTSYEYKKVAQRLLNLTLKLKVEPGTYNNVKIYPMITLDTVSDYEPYVGGIPSPNPAYPQEIKSVVNPVVKVYGKNLLKPTLVTTTKNGVTCTANGDGTYTMNGTATDKTIFVLFRKRFAPNGTYKLTGCPIGGSVSTYNLGCWNYNGAVTNSDIGNGINFKISSVVDDSNIYIVVNKGVVCNNLVFKPMVTVDTSVTYNDYQPYTETTATLPYTLNAIPVESGGNVTIDGQQYIADYVDIENKKLVRCVGKDIYDGNSNIIEKQTNSFGKRFKFSISSEAKTNSSSKIILLSSMEWDYVKTIGFSGNYIDGKDYGYVTENSLLFSTNRFRDESELLTYLSQSPITIMYPLATPTTIDLNDEEVQAFKVLATYYPTTNISVTSEQLDGYTTFNYPISMANGWNYIKEQLGDTREYIYDMDLQSAEAYINSEYAVALAELEV